MFSCMQASCHDAMSTFCVEPGWNRGGTGVERWGWVTVGTDRRFCSVTSKLFWKKKSSYFSRCTHTSTLSRSRLCFLTVNMRGKKKKKTKVQLGVFAVSLVKHWYVEQQRGNQTRLFQLKVITDLQANRQWQITGAQQSHHRDRNS